VLLFLCLLPTTGCSYLRQANNPPTHAGLTLVLPGIEGASFVNSNIVKGLVDGDVNGEIEVWDWTSGNALRSLEHLRDRERLVQQTTRLRERLLLELQSESDRPISLVAHSGGAGVALEAVRSLPAGHSLATVVLLAPAVRRDYPLNALQERTRYGVWSFRSPADLQLTLGTTLAGTIDGDHGSAAGAFGFLERPSELKEVPFRAGMILDGHWGGHLGPTQVRFIRRHVAPIIRLAQMHQARAF